MRRLLLFFVIQRFVNSSCPAGFELVREGECRGFTDFISNTTHDVARETVIARCESLPGQPVIIHDEERQTYWMNKANNTWRVIIIGLVCNCTSKKWQWTDGSAVDFKPHSYSDQLDRDCITSFTWIIFGVEPNGDSGRWNGWDGGFGEVDIDCATQLHQPIPSADGCENFDDDSEDGVCYQVGATAETWEEAQMNCKKFGANLASIHNQQENSFVRRLAVSKGAVNGLFLGAKTTGNGNNFGWVDESEWDFDNFYPGFPMPGIGDCIAMDTTKTAGQWMNMDCSAKLPVACERDHHDVDEPICSSDPKEEGTLITSPGFPYNASTTCDYFLTADVGKTVELQIVFLEANTCCDFLVIHDGFLGGNLIANITGEVRNVTYSSTSNLMRVSWQPDGGVNVRGMAMTYRGV